MFSKYLLYEMGTQWINYRKLSTPMNSFNSATQARIIKAWLSPGSEWIKWQDASYKELYHDLGVEEKFPQENFRVLSMMRILAKIKLVILDLVW